MQLTKRVRELYLLGIRPHCATIINAQRTSFVHIKNNTEGYLMSQKACCYKNKL
jgi:hypothetical protein